MSYCFIANDGSDSTGDGSASNPYATANKAIGSSPAYTLSGSETNYLVYKPGIYREAYTMGVSPSSGGPLVIVGDADGSLFTANGGTGATGLVDWRAWTDDATPITSAACFTSADKSYVTLRRLKMTAGTGTGNAGCLDARGSMTDWTIEDCVFVGSQIGTRPWTVLLASSFGGASQNIIVRRCDFSSTVNISGTFASLYVRSPLNASDYDVGILVEDCRFFGGCKGVFYDYAFGSGSQNGIGLKVQNNTFLYVVQAIGVGTSFTYTSPAVVARGNAVLQGQVGVVGANTSQIDEDGNVFCCPTPRTSTNTGSNSVASVCPAFSVHDERLYGSNPRPFGEPSATSPMKAFGNYGTPSSVDLYDQTRPATASAGALERDVFEVPSNTYIFQVEG